MAFKTWHDDPDKLLKSQDLDDNFQIVQDHFDDTVDPHSGTMTVTGSIITPMIENTDDIYVSPNSADNTAVIISNQGAGDMLLVVDGPMLIGDTLSHQYSDLTIDVNDIDSDCTLYVLNSDGTYKASLDVENNLTIGGDATLPSATVTTLTATDASINTLTVNDYIIMGLSLQDPTLTNIITLEAAEVVADRVYTLPEAGADATILVTPDTPARGDIVYHNGTTWKMLPAGTTGKYLKTRGAGADPMWDTPATAPAGADTQVQFNDGGALAGDADLTFNKATNTLAATNLTVTGTTTLATSLTGVLKGTSGVVSAGSIDISSDTNLATSYPLTLTGDTVGLGYNTTNLKLTSNQLNTIQDIATSSNVLFGSVTSNQFSNFIDTDRYGFLNQTQTTISFDGTKVFTLADAGSGWSYYRAGIKHTISGNKTIDLTTVENPLIDGRMYYIFIDSTTGDLSANITGWTLLDTKVPVATIKWNNTLTPKYIMAEERHSCLIDRRMHYYEHTTNGTKSVTVGAIAGSTVNTDNNAAKTFSIAESKIADEDLLQTLAALPDPNGTATDYLVAYRTGVASWGWKLSNMPFVYNVGNTNDVIQYDNGTSGMVDCGTGAGALTRWVNSYLLMTNANGVARYIILMGQAEYTSLAAAQAETPTSFNLSGLPVIEGVFTHRITWTTITSTSQGKCRMAVLPANISGTTVSIPSNQTSIDHNVLANLPNGDVHTQYAFLNGRATGQTLYGGTGASENLTLCSTTNATKGYVLFSCPPAIYDATSSVKGVLFGNNGGVYDTKLWRSNTNTLTLGGSDVAAQYLNINRTSSAVIADFSLGIASNNSPTYTIVHGGTMTGEKAGVATSANPLLMSAVPATSGFYWDKITKAAGGSFSSADVTNHMSLVAGKLSLPVTGSGGGIVLGGDVELYRGATDTLYLTASLQQTFGTTNASMTGAFYAYTPISTANDATSKYGQYMQVLPQVASGFTNSASIGANGQAIRIWRGGTAGVDDNGTMTLLLSQYNQFGHYNSNSVASSTTTDIEGYRSDAQFIQGICTNLKHINIKALSVSSTPAIWAANISIASQQRRRPTVANGFYYVANVGGGTSGNTEPTWPTTVGGTVVDNTVTWTAIAVTALTNQYGIYMEAMVGTGATNNYQIFLAGTGTTATNGISWSDTNLYRSGTAALKTDNAFTVGTTLNVNGNTTLGDASTDTITMTGRCIFRTAGSDPQHATPGSRPAGSVGELVYYGGKLYFCTNTSTPTWEKITSA